MFIPLLFPKDTSSYTMATGDVGTKIWNPRASVMTVSNAAQLGMFLQVSHAPCCCCLRMWCSLQSIWSQARATAHPALLLAGKFVRTCSHNGANGTCLAYP